MDEAKANEIRQWLIKAEHDLGSAKRLITGDQPFLDTAVYHCQQAAEKALKAYLTLRDVTFQKIHDISVLIEQCMELDKTFEQIMDVSETLTPYATAFRYPGDVLEPHPSDAEEAVGLAGVVIDFVLKRMPEEVKGG
jgi:HEPN domain-containing protein